MAKTLGLDLNIRSGESAFLHLDASLLKARVKTAEVKNFIDKEIQKNFYSSVKDQFLLMELTFAFLESFRSNSVTGGFIFACRGSF